MTAKKSVRVLAGKKKRKSPPKSRRSKTARPKMRRVPPAEIASDPNMSLRPEDYVNKQEAPVTAAPEALSSGTSLGDPGFEVDVL